MQAGVSNQVTRVLEILERKWAGLLLEIDEKPEIPNNVIVPNFQRVFLNGQTNIAICWRMNKVTCSTDI